MAYFSALGGTGGTSATITVTYSEDFYGLTITATNGTTTLTKTATSSGTLVFDVSEGGTWVVSGTVEGATYSESVDVTFEYTAPPLVALPDGSTALPVNDIQMWLKCAAIRDKTTYTTLADVLADTETFIALCADSNACDYMARSTNWASGVAADSTAMLIVGKYNYCGNALLDDNTWETAIRNSAYSSYVDPVPVTWSNTLIHSAVEDNIFYMDEGTPVALCTIASGDTIDVDMESFKGQTLTLVSTVAKDPTNLSNDFSMNVRITPNITEIYLMPYGVLYWWGHNGGVEQGTTANGWSHSVSLVGCTFNKNNVSLVGASASQLSVCGSSNKHIATEIYCIEQGSNTSGNSVMMYAASKNVGTATQDSTPLSDTLSKITLTPSNVNDGYIEAQAIRGASVTLYAMWYE